MKIPHHTNLCFNPVALEFSGIFSFAAGFFYFKIMICSRVITGIYKQKSEYTWDFYIRSGYGDIDFIQKNYEFLGLFYDKHNRFKDEVINDLKKGGVYLLKDNNGKVLYIGKSKNIIERFNTHLRTEKKFTSFIVFIIEEKELRDLAERLFISLFKPYLNSQLYKNTEEDDYDVSKYLVKKINKKIDSLYRDLFNAHYKFESLDKKIKSIEKFISNE